MTSTSPSDREKVGFDLRLPLGELEAIDAVALPGVLGTVIGNVIREVLDEPGVELDTLNVLVTPETRSTVCEVEGHACECPPDSLHVRVFAERDRPTA